MDFKCHAPAAIGDKCLYSTDPMTHVSEVPLLIQCGASAYCDPVSSSCRPLPKAGEPCLTSLPVAGLGFTSCDPDPTLMLTCDVSGSPQGTGTCRGPGVAGSDCRTVQCDPRLPLVCDFSTFTCKPIPGLGEPCLNGQCQSPYACGQNPGSFMPVCVARTKGNGEACTSPVECISGNCAAALGQPQPTCAPGFLPQLLMCSGR
jgi:hypothetical protein